MIPKKYLKELGNQNKNMRRRELLGFDCQWRGCYLSSQVYKEGGDAQGNNVWEACDDGSFLAVSVECFFFYENISPNLTHPPNPNGMSGKKRMR